MHEWADILGRATLAFALAVAGGALSAGLGVSHARLCGLISLAAGTLTGVTLFAILPESWTALRWWELLLAFGSGYLVFALLSRYVFHVCPACAASHFDEATTHRFAEIAGALIIALAVHSTIDGVALAAGHEAHGDGDAAGLAMLVAVCVHKMPEGLALGALLLGAGVGRARAIIWVAAVEATTPVGAALGLGALRGVAPVWVLAVLAHAGGGFVFLAAHAVFGELVQHAKRTVLGAFVAGVLLIAALTAILPRL
jgi:ZIP family zinc transporter